jgi:hypothetical protein
MDSTLGEAYAELEEAIKQALKAHRGNRSVLSIALNTLLLYPDRPFGLGSLTGFDYDPITRRRESFLIAETRDLATNCQYAKERRLLEEVKAEVAQGRRCQIYVVYTQKRDVTERLESILHREAIRVAVLRSTVPPEQRESWYERQVRQGIEVVICHPKLVQTGLDYVESGDCKLSLLISFLPSSKVKRWQRANVKLIQIGESPGKKRGVGETNEFGAIFPDSRKRKRKGVAEDPRRSRSGYEHIGGVRTCH